MGLRSRIVSTDVVDGQQLGEHAAFADPPRDQLRVLAPEIEDEHLLGGLGRRRWRRRPQSSATPTPAETAARPFDPMPTDCSFCSFLPSLISAGATITSARWKERMSS